GRRDARSGRPRALPPRPRTLAEHASRAHDRLPLRQGPHHQAEQARGAGGRALQEADRPAEAPRPDQAARAPEQRAHVGHGGARGGLPGDPTLRKAPVAIRITRVYTRRGDRGETDLVGGARIPKDHARIDAYGTVDELNAALGVVRAFNAADRGRDRVRRELDAVLRKLQSELFDLGAELATPPASFVQGMFRVGDAE